LPAQHHNVKEGPDIAGVAALVGDASRAAMLSALMGGKALSAGELARVAGVTPQTATGHLARLQAAAMLRVVCQGRHRYYELAGSEVAALLENLLGLAGRIASPPRTGPRDIALKRARVCYDHLAGEIAVDLYTRLRGNGAIADLGTGESLTARGIAAFDDIGVGLATYAGHRPLCRACIDWSERRPHLAGHAGAALLDRLQALDLVRRVAGSRAVILTAKGEAHLPKLFTA
jgi:DNA-binding transcriptional ArsR family regulator